MNRFLLLLIYALPLSAQLPETDIHLFEIENKKGNLSISGNYTITNRPGYDNQPSFSSNEKNILYVSIREDKQADLYTYEIRSKKSLQLTKTTESEYSPTFDPFTGKINCVVVEKDSAQRIHSYDEIMGMESGVLFNEDSVGYFNFLNKDTVLYYKLTAPHSLRLHSISKGTDIYIASNIIRGFKTINRHEFIFGIKDSAKVNFYRYDLLLKKAFPYCSYPSLAEDIIWHSTWGLLKSEQAKILRYDPKEMKWIDLFDLSSFGIKKITRFTFDSKNRKLLVVDNKP